MILVFVGLVVAMFIGTLVEYWVHWLMHHGLFLTRFHMLHHRENNADDWLKDLFKIYIPGFVPVMLLPFIPLIWVESSWLFYSGIGWALGTVSYLGVFSLCHHMHHQNPQKLFWLAPGFHDVHHTPGNYRHNYGVVVDWWDRILGTYKNP